ncbi:MAG TPA: protein kinase, partial [Gemmataceae bacterium]
MKQGEYEGSQPGAVLAGAAQSAWIDSVSPGLSDKSIAIDQAYDEFCRRRELGEPPDPDAFCQDFPYQSSLRRLLEADRFVQENPHLLENVGPTRYPEPGAYFLGFILHRELGRGAFARVFLATEPALGNRRVAVKVALHGGAEAETLGRLEHPNIVSVHSVQKDPASGLTAVCMPYLGGANLCHLLDRLHSRLPVTAEVIQQTIDEGRPTAETALPASWTKQESYPAAVARIGEQLADGLASIHAQGICHRDLKPSNVLLAANGRAMLLDFNLSFDAQASEQRLGGTLPYMSPEHLAATDAKPSVPSSALDARSDLFSLGVLLYELLTGVHPFGPVSLKLSADEVRAHLRQRHEEGPRPLCRLNPRVNKTLARVVERCLAADPADRPQSAAELARQLRRTQPLVSRARRWVAGHRRAVAAMALMVILAGATGALGSHNLTPKAVTHSAQEWADRGRESFDKGQYADAAESLSEAQKMDAENWELAYRLGWAYLRKGDAESRREAEKCFKTADDLYRESGQGQNNGRALAALGYCFNLSGGQQQAIAAYNRAVQAGYDTAEVENNLGLSYERSGTPKNQIEVPADSAFSRAIAMKPQLQAAFYNRALLHANDVGKYFRSQPDSPFEDISKAIEIGRATGRDTARLYYDAAGLHASAAEVFGRLSNQAFAGQACATGSGPYEAAGCLLEKACLFLSLRDEAAYHRHQAVVYARQA